MFSKNYKEKKGSFPLYLFPSRSSGFMENIRQTTCLGVASKTSKQKVCSNLLITKVAKREKLEKSEERREGSETKRNLGTQPSTTKSINSVIHKLSFVDRTLIY